jgi:hypothetical protein
MELRDEFGLFRWYQGIFFPHTLNDPNFDYQRMYGLLTKLQIMFNSWTPKPCRGMKFMTPGLRANDLKGHQYCGHPLCPTCWHRRQTELIQALAEIPEVPWLCFRSTWFVKWDIDVHPRCVTRFKGAGSRYKLLAYTLNWDASVAFLDDEDAKHDEFGGQLSYQLLGLFWSHREVRDTQDTAGQVNVRLDPTTGHSETIGIVDKDYVARDQLLPTWWAKLRHPWQYRGHTLFRDYIERFYDYKPAGKSWTRIQSQNKDESKQTTKAK